MKKHFQLIKREKTYIVQTRALFCLFSVTGYITTCTWSLVFLHKKPFFSQTDVTVIFVLWLEAVAFGHETEIGFLYPALCMLLPSVHSSIQFTFVKKVFVLLQRANMDHLWFDKQETRLCHLCVLFEPGEPDKTDPIWSNSSHPFGPLHSVVTIIASKY